MLYAQGRTDDAIVEGKVTEVQGCEASVHLHPIRVRVGVRVSVRVRDLHELRHRPLQGETRTTQALCELEPLEPSIPF